MIATEREMPREEIRRRMDDTIQELYENGPDQPLPGAVAEPPRPRRSRMVIAALALVIGAELAVIGVVSRIEKLEAPPIVSQTPCDNALAAIETGLAQYRAAYGSLPGTLEQLVPDHLAAIPRTTGASVQYQPQGEGFVLSCTEGN